MFNQPLPAIAMSRYQDYLDRRALDRRRANIYRMLRSGMSPQQIAATLQLFAGQGVGGYQLMPPALFAQLVNPQAAADVYGTMATQRLGLEGLRTQRYNQWLQARSALDQAALNARQAALNTMLGSIGAYWMSRPAVPVPESPYTAATQSAIAGYQFANAAMANQIAHQQLAAQEANRQRVAAMLRSMVADQNLSPEQRLDAFNKLIAVYSMPLGAAR